MADSNFRGPLNSMGGFEDLTVGTSSVVIANQSNTVRTRVEGMDGPSMLYQNSGFPNALIGVPFQKDIGRRGQQDAVLTNTDVYAVDNFPQTAGTATLAALQTTVGATLGLATTQAQNTIPGQAFLACGVPIVPIGTTSVVVVQAIDFGFTTGTTAANSSTVVCLDNTQLQAGQWIVIGGAGNTAGSAALVTQVQSIATGNITGVTISPVAATAITNAPIGQANIFDGGLLPIGGGMPGPATPVANAAYPAIAGGLGRFMNPREMSARAVVVWAGTTSATAAYTITGYDVWGNLMAEKVTVPSLANRGAAGSTIYGAKAFKYLLSCAIQTASSGSVAIGLTDIFGFPFRADDFSQVEVWWNQGNVNYNKTNCFLPAYTTAPSTNTTGDVRGTIQVSTLGTGTAAPVQTAQVSNGTTRLTIIQNIPVWNTLFTNPNNVVPMFGINNATA